MANAPGQADAPGVPVQASPASPLFSIAAIVAFIVSGLAVFNAMGATMGVVLAVVAIVLAGVACMELIVPRDRGGRVSLFTLLMAVLAVGIAATRLSGVSVLGQSLPDTDPRATTTMSP